MLNDSLRGCYTAQPKASSNNYTESVQLPFDASIYLRFAVTVTAADFMCMEIICLFTTHVYAKYSR